MRNNQNGCVCVCDDVVDKTSEKYRMFLICSTSQLVNRDAHLFGSVLTTKKVDKRD